MCRATLRCGSAALQKPSAQDKARSKTAVLAAGVQEDLASLREKLTVKDVSTLELPQHRSRSTCCMPLKVLTSVISIACGMSGCLHKGQTMLCCYASNGGACDTGCAGAAPRLCWNSGTDIPAIHSGQHVLLNSPLKLCLNKSYLEL